MASTDTNWTNAYRDMVERNLGLLSDKQQERLRNAKVAVPGAGGIGGVALEVLARTGVGAFRTVDRDTFEPSNLNRQIFAFRDTCGQRKIDVAAETVRRINPEARIDTFDHVDEDNVGDVLDGCDVVVLSIDSLGPCLVISREARKRSIPVVEGWALPMGNVRVITAETPSLEELYDLPTRGRAVKDIDPEELKKLHFDLTLGLAKIEGVAEFFSISTAQQISKGKTPSFAPMVWLTSVLMANEAIKLLLNWGRPALAPDYALYDPYNLRVPRTLNRIPLERLGKNRRKSA